MAIDRLRSAMLKPVQVSPADAGEPMSLEELRDAAACSSDKERLVGLIAAPLAAMIGLLVMTSLVDNDPRALLGDGRANPAHVSIALYHDLTIVMIALSVAVLATSMLRKRVLAGIAMALFGLAIFNLHYWGFGIPFLMAGAWLLQRAYRIQQDLRLAGAGIAGPRGAKASRTRR
jgi:hypothetical protein